MSVVANPQGLAIGEHSTLAGQAAPKSRCVLEDEVDIHLNPKIGLDWMLEGQRKEVVTRGKNDKRDLAGALDVEGLWPRE